MVPWSTRLAHNPLPYICSPALVKASGMKKLKSMLIAIKT